MSTIFTIRKNYTVKRDDPKIATKRTFVARLSRMSTLRGFPITEINTI